MPDHGSKPTNTGQDGIFGTFHKGNIENVHPLGAYLGPINSFGGTDMRCFAFGKEGVYPHNNAMIVKLDKQGNFVDKKMITSNIYGVSCSHTCIAAGNVGQYPSAEGVLFDKFVH